MRKDYPVLLTSAKLKSPSAKAHNQALRLQNQIEMNLFGPYSLSSFFKRLGLSNILTSVGPISVCIVSAGILLQGPLSFATEERVNLAEQKVSKIYSPKELTELLASPELQGIMGEIRAQLESVPAEKKKKLTDTELAFRWGSDWFGLGDHLRFSHQLETEMKQVYDDYVVSKRYIPDYKKDRKKPDLKPEWTVIPYDQIGHVISRPYAPRIMELEKALPGFVGWLLEGSLEIPWVLTDDPLTQKFCQNEQVHRIKKTTVACLSPEMVKIQRSWFEKGLPKDQSKIRADVFIHELVRYRATLLAQGIGITQATQDAITAQITESILNPNTSPQDLYAQLEKANLLIESSRIHELRVYELVLTMKKKMAVLAQMIQFNMICDASPGIDKRPFEIQVQKALEQVTECENYLTPDYDRALCEIKTVAFHIWDHRVRCLKRR